MFFVFFLSLFSGEEGKSLNEINAHMFRHVMLATEPTAAEQEIEKWEEEEEEEEGRKTRSEKKM